MIKSSEIKNITVFALLFVASLMQSCTNISQNKSLLNVSGNPAFQDGGSTGTYSHTLKNVSVQALTATTGTPDLELSLSTDTSASTYQPLTGFCGLANTNPCACELKWTEVNAVNGGNNSYQRTKRLAVIAVESGRVKCHIAQSGAGSWDEIANATVITMNIVAIQANVTGLTVKAINYKKGTSVGPGGDFLDDTLTPFRNIHRYACFTKRSTSHEIINQYITSTPSGGGQAANLILGSRFCSSSTSASGTGKCANPRNGFSAQSYYRNFYIRSDKMGEINSTNNTYDCPKVVEALTVSAGQANPSGQGSQYWPLDATFSLATSYSPDWNVGVRAASILLKAGDPNSTADACVNEDTTKRLSEAGVVTKCMGYAKKPKVDGTCGTIKDSNGRIRPLTRLRRYRVIYPPMFKPSGEVEATNSAADEVYVADRLVVDTNGIATGSMIYGPKPCNYAWFDHEGVANRGSEGAITRGSVSNFFSNFLKDTSPNFPAPGYISTSTYKYTPFGSAVNLSVNPDGLIFPNTDRGGSTTSATNYASCSATLPIIDSALGTANRLRLITTHQSRPDSIVLGQRNLNLSEIHIQPIDPWVPNYLEDISFQACAPVADPYLEPPLHFYKKDSNTIAWCTEPYPTQNPYWYHLNNAVKPQNPTVLPTSNLINYPAGALVKGDTSHKIAGGLLDANNPCTGTNSSKLCTLTGFDADPSCNSYLIAASAKVSTISCDRTVTFDSNQAFLGFPLQAEDKDIEKMLKDDADQLENRNFSCQYSVNADPNKVNAKIPSSGCCGIVSGTAILSNLIAGPNGSVGHLEPFKNAAVPNIRFCGSPVE